MSVLINPWWGWAPSSSWFFQEPHPSIISSLGLWWFGNSLYPPPSFASLPLPTLHPSVGAAPYTFFFFSSAFP